MAKVHLAGKGGDGALELDSTCLIQRRGSPEGICAGAYFLKAVTERGESKGMGGALWAGRSPSRQLRLYELQSPLGPILN